MFRPGDVLEHPGFRCRMSHRRGIYVPTRMPMFPLPNFIRRLGRFRPERGALLMFPMIWTSGCDPIEETIRPVSDVQFTNWATFGGPSAAWDALDDEGDDTDGIQGTSPGSAVCGSTDAIDFEVHLDDPTNRPGSSQCQGMRFDNRVSDETDFGEVEGRAGE